MTNRKLMTFILTVPGMLVLILDSRTGFAAAREGIDLCIVTLIPSMFPFFFLSILMTGSLAGQTIRFLRPVAKLCRIPEGAESLIVIGLLGGYPVGAQNIISAYHQGVLSREDAQRMAVFCNNAGPAFLFGYLGTLFHNPIYSWILYGIQVASSLIVGWVLPGGTRVSSSGTSYKQIPIAQALNQAIKVMGQVCGWVILFRVLIGFLDRWLFWVLPDQLGIFFTGLLDLSNGCNMLAALPSDGLRMVMASAFLGFGGICVLLQTYSIAGAVSLPMYLPGKVLQGCISFVLAYLVQFFLPNADPCMVPPVIFMGIGCIFVCLLLVLRKDGNNSSNLCESIV